MRRLLVVLLAAVVIGAGVAGFIELRRRGASGGPVGNGSTGEPVRYSALVVSTAESDGATRVAQTRTARSGEMYREEWTELGKNRVMIWRPDLGKSFLLDSERRVFVESSVYPDAAETQRPSGTQVDPVALERVLSSVPLDNGETRALPPEKIDGYNCDVIEQRRVFAADHGDTTKVFRARELNGMVIRTESESVRGNIRSRYTVELKEIRMSVSPDEFNVPQGYVKVERLNQ